MKQKIVKTKDGEVYKTKDNKEIVEYTFEEGDLFIPFQEKYITDTKGKFDKFVMPCKVKDKDGKQIFTQDESDKIFVKLTSAQANSLKKIRDSGISLMENLFNAYKYNSEKHGEQIGVGLYKDVFKEPKSFEDFAELMKKKKDK